MTRLLSTEVYVVKLLLLLVDVKLFVTLVKVLPSAPVSAFILVDVSPANSDDTLFTTFVVLVVSPFTLFVFNSVLVYVAAVDDTLFTTSVILTVLLSFWTVMLFLTSLLIVATPSAFTVVIAWLAALLPVLPLTL